MSLYHIRVTGSEENKDNGFFALMTSGSSVVCLENEEYVTPDDNLIEKLNKAKIEYQIIRKD